MYKSFASLFVDPETHEPLRLEVDFEENENILSGRFVHEGSGRVYPILRGIPRFVPSESPDYAGSFAWQWHRWPRVQFESENKGKPMFGHTTHMWESITNPFEHQPDHSGSMILDIGCGPGRFIDVCRNKKAMVVGVDYSLACEVAYRHFKDDPGVCIAQADALKLPFAPGTFDGAYSIGVLHHTPDPQKGLSEARRVLKAGGWCAISVYGRDGYYNQAAVQFWRRIFARFWPVFGHRLPLLYTYFVIYMFKKPSTMFPLFGRFIQLFFPFVNLPDRNWSLLDTFDSITPCYQSAHTSFEVFSWFKRLQFDDIEPTNWSYTAYRGRKPGG
jgi:SAM-dependent methyltransferase